MSSRRYVVVYEQTPNNWSAYLPDLPGCIATGKSREDVHRLIREAVELHVESLRAHGEPLPEPGVWTGAVDVDVPDDVVAGQPGSR